MKIVLSIAEAQNLLEKHFTSHILSHLSGAGEFTVVIDGISQRDIIINEVKRLMADEKKIMAVKYFREQTGAGLADSKAYVESIDKGLTPDFPIG